MKKLNLEELVVVSFDTGSIDSLRGTVRGNQATGTCSRLQACEGLSIASPTCDPAYNTCAYNNTCAQTCPVTNCVTECQGGGDLNSDKPTCRTCEGGDSVDGNTWCDNHTA